MTQRDRIVVGVLALVAVVAGFYMTVVKPTNAEVAELDTQIAQAEQRRDTALADLQAATTAREQYRQDQRTLAILGKAVPADDDVPSLLYHLHKAARRAGVSFEAVTVGQGAGAPVPGATEGEPAAPTAPGTTEGPGGLQMLPLKITFNGDFFKLDRFLKQVHRFARIGGERVDVRGRLLTVDGIQLTPSEDGLPVLKAEITANAYVAPEDGADAAGSGSGSATTTAAQTTPAPPAEGTEAPAPPTDTAEGTAR